MTTPSNGDDVQICHLLARPTHDSGGWGGWLTPGWADDHHFLLLHWLLSPWICPMCWQNREPQCHTEHHELQTCALGVSVSISSSSVRLNPPLRNRRVWFCLCLFVVLNWRDPHETGLLSLSQITLFLIWDTQLSLLISTLLQPSTGHWTKSLETLGCNPFGLLYWFY